ncbi:sensor histidine kinase [Muricauda sp. SCSIO 64092]|uniref:tetratricopeptide repeat-containing sensor histidine kinase n=1 Tax=Allomuricauda sp. SCSIO 64092 TaxID=2908842 RepID=UPI001FF313E8|nr:tetratricopeptide repeat protein [Muricauda sp. SCSIO 64092]UOY08964.1 sensor histidine kinase [Muricauda sp. SCSIO 64092]
MSCYIKKLCIAFLVLISNGIFSTQGVYAVDTVFLNSDTALKPIQQPELDQLMANSTAGSVLLKLERYFRERKAYSKYHSSDKKIRLLSLNTLTNYLIETKALDSALNVNERALKIQLDTNKELMVEAYHNAATIQYELSYYNDGMEWSLKALDLAQSIGDKKGQIEALNDAGITHWRFGNITKAKEYLEEALDMSRSDPVDYQSTILSNLGLVYLEEKNYEKAIELFESSVEIDIRKNEDHQIGITYNNLGLAYKQLNRFKGANMYLEKAYRISKANKDYKNVVLSLGNNSRVLAKLGMYDEASEKLDEALDILKMTGSSDGYAHIHYAYFLLNKEIGNYESALSNLQLHHTWKDSVLLKNNKAKITELNLKHEARQKENEILRLSEQNLIQERDLLKKDRMIKTFVLGGLVLILLLISIAFIFLKRAELRKQKMIFDTIAKTEIEEQHRIARDLHDSIGTMLASLKNHLSLIMVKNQKSETALDQAKKMLTKSIEETRRISHNMMPEELIKFGLVSAIEGILDDVRVSSNMKVTFEHDMNNTVIDKSKELHIYRIVQELVQNSLKHSKSDFLTVILKCDDRHISLKVEDKGKGFEYVKEMANGYGLKNIQSRVAFLKGKLSIETQINKGSIVNLNIPLS